MTHPTGEHKPGVKLLSGYVDVDVRVNKALNELKSDLKGVEAQAETSAVAAKGSIMRHIGGSGAPAAEQLSNDLRSGLDAGADAASLSFRDKFWKGFLGSSGVSGIEAGKPIGEKLASDIATGFTNQFAAQGSIMRPMASAIRAGTAEAEAEGGAAGHRIGVRMLGGLASAMENSSGWGGRLSGALERGGSAAFGAFEATGVKAAEHVKSGLSGIGGAAMGLVSGPMAALIAAGTTIGGTFEVLKGGFERLDAIETFDARLKALGFTAAQSKNLIDGLNEATKNTQFHLTDVMGIGQRAAQQNPNMTAQEIADYVKTLENASAVSGKVDPDSLGRFIDRIRTLGSLSMPRQLTQLTTAGLPIAKWLMDDLHMSSDELDKFIKDKKLTYDVFMQELQKHTADGAAEMSKTIGAQSKIMGDNINRIGGDLVAPFFGQTGGLMEAINSKLSGLDAELMKPQVQATIKNVGDTVETGVKDVFGGLTSFFKGGVGHWGNFFSDVTRQFMSGAAPGGFNHGKGIDAQDVGHALGNVAHAAENVFHALDNVGHAAGNVAHATGNVVHALGNVGHALGNVNHALHNAGDFIHSFIAEEVKFDEWLVSLPGKFGSMIEHVGGAMVDKVGSFFSNFHPTIFGHKFADGGMLPSSAMIQSPVGANGLVQWAEPSTGGEAFIPLDGGKRSQEIWLETGRRLGMLSFAPGGIRGGGGASSDTEGTFSRIMGHLDKFSDRLEKLHKGFDGVNDSLRRAKGGDLQGGLDGLTKTVKDLTPVAKDLKDGLQATKDALPDTIPGLPHLSRPTSIRDRLRNFDTGAFANRANQASGAAQRVNDITSQLGYGDDIPGLGAITEGAAGAQEAHEFRGHINNVINAIREGRHNEALEHGADLVNVAASLSRRLTGVDVGPVAEKVNEAVGLQWALQGAGKTLGAAAKGLEARALPSVLSRAPGALGALGEGFASDLAAPVAVGAIGGKAISDYTEEHNWFGIADRIADTYDDQGISKNPIERFFDRTPILNFFSPPEDIRNRNKNRREAAEKAARPWDPADNDMLLNPANAPKALPPSELASAITSDAPGQMSDEDLAALGYAGGTSYAGYLPGYSKKDNLLGHIKGNLFGLAGGEAIIKTEAAQRPWVRSLVNALNHGYAGGTAQAGYDFVSNMEGTPYSQGNRDDCSGMASQVINSFLGLPPRSSMFTTRNEREWLLAHGFVMGQGPPGTLRVGWYNHGTAPDDGHTAITLPDGTPVESGGSHDNFMAGGGAAGADASEFDQHAYLPLNKIQGGAVGGVGGGGGVMTPDGSTGASGSGGGGGGAYGPQSAATALISAGYSAAQENLPPGFSNPMEWGAVKSGAALFRFLGALGKAKGVQGSQGLSMVGALLGGNASGVASDMAQLGAFGPVGIGSPQDAATLIPANLSLAQSGGPLPAAGQGGETHIDQSQNTTFTGDIHDTTTKQHAEKVRMDRAKNQLPAGVKGNG
jgi:hypothetical protein